MLGGQGRGRLSSMRAGILKRLTATLQDSWNRAPLPLGEGGGWGKPTAEGELLSDQSEDPEGIERDPDGRAGEVRSTESEGAKRPKRPPTATAAAPIP